MAKKNPGGRPSIFGPRDGEPVHLRLTKFSTKRLQSAYRDLATLATSLDPSRTWEPEQISDADAIEFLMRGVENTTEFLKKKAAGK